MASDGDHEGRYHLDVYTGHKWKDANYYDGSKSNPIKTDFHNLEEAVAQAEKLSAHRVIMLYDRESDQQRFYALGKRVLTETEAVLINCQSEELGVAVTHLVDQILYPPYRALEPCTCEWPMCGETAQTWFEINHSEQCPVTLARIIEELAADAVHLS